MIAQKNLKGIFHALNLAAIAHKDQKRKGSGGSPYINHLIEVTYLLTDIAKVENIAVLQAAVLHDILEDTAITEADLVAQVNPEVVQLVKALSDDKSLSLTDRRQQQIAHLSHASDEVKLIKLADICSNISSIPETWDTERIKTYLDWIEQVASLCVDVSIPLAQEYRARLEQAKGLTQSDQKQAQTELTHLLADDEFKEMYALALKVFGSENSAYAWLNEYNIALQGKPIEIAQSRNGLSCVVENLGAISYGGVA
jgi:guanosine-3',5'-bis(diphosphate) 3'-pyrophosphohydrolase